MNKLGQFWALFKFQAVLKPYIIMFPLALSTSIWIPYLTLGKAYHPGLDLLLSNQNLFFVAWIGFMLLDPEGFQPGGYAAIWPSGSEFLLTRAVDRRLVLRARSAFFLLLVLAIPLCAFLARLQSPRLIITEYNKIDHQQAMDRLPGSIPVPPDKNGISNEIMIPNGNILVDAWRIWLFLALAIASQVFILLMFPLKYRRYISWAVIMLIVLLPLGRLFLTAGAHFEGPASNETLFFVFVAHQWLFWLAAILALPLSQLWCERRFSSLEQ
jgi:hypothetical protein